VIQDPEALCQSAEDHYGSGRKVKAAELLSQAAAQGHAGAQCNLGLMYRDGEGVPQNTKKAAELLSQAAAQGDADSKFYLGMMYRTGDGVPQDEARGTALLEQAASQGDESAQKALAGITAQAGNTKPAVEAAATPLPDP
jgi:TPR repeat protein